MGDAANGGSAFSAGGARASVFAGGGSGAIGVGLSSCGDAGNCGGTGGEDAIALRCSRWTGAGARNCLGRESTACSGKAGVNAELSAREAGAAAASLDAEDGSAGVGSAGGNGGCAMTSFGAGATAGGDSVLFVTGCGCGDDAAAGGSDGCATTGLSAGRGAGGGSAMSDFAACCAGGLSDRAAA